MKFLEGQGVKLKQSETKQETWRCKVYFMNFVYTVQSIRIIRTNQRLLKKRGTIRIQKRERNGEKR